MMACADFTVDLASQSCERYRLMSLLVVHKTNNEILGQIPFTSMQFPLYEFFKLQLSHYLKRKPLHAYEAAVCGSVAGGIAAALTTPLDVVKTRVMLDLRVCILLIYFKNGNNTIQSSSKEPLPTLLQRFKHIFVSEGLPGLFSGVVPRTIWISAGGAVFLGTYEFAVQGLMGL
jgi:solute carrier family 25 (mitochondrial S-adenosylmethionine transporter), member 26